MSLSSNSFYTNPFLRAKWASGRANGRGATAIFRPLGALSLRSNCCASFPCSLVLREQVIFFLEPWFVRRRDLNYRTPCWEEYGRLAALFPLCLTRGKFFACEKKNKVWLCVDVVNIARKALDRSSLSISSVIFPVSLEDFILIFRLQAFLEQLSARRMRIISKETATTVLRSW